MATHLTAAHWVYLGGIVVILLSAAMMARGIGLN